MKKHALLRLTAGRATMLSLAAAAALAATAQGATLRNVLMITVDGEHGPPSPHVHPTCR